MFRRFVAVVAITAVLTPAAARAAGEALPPCPADGFMPLGDPYTGPGLSILVPPLALLLAASRDKLADEPRRPWSFRVVDAQGRPVETAHVALLHDGRRFVGETLHDGSLDLPDAVYTVVAAAGGTPARWGQRRIDTRTKGTSNTFEIKLDHTLPQITTRPPLDLSADGRAPAGGPLRFAWTGPHQAAAGLAVMPRDEEGGKALREAGVGTAGTSAVDMPAAEGSYDVRLLLCAPRITLATWQVEVGAPQIRLAAPDKVQVGRTFEVSAAGRIGARFDLAVAPLDSETTLQSETVERASPRTRLTAPLTPGRWEVIYRADDDDHTVLARRPITVEAASIEITAPAEVRLGAPVRISYTGSAGGGGGAVLELWSKDGIRWTDDLSLDGERLPARAGEHELRLVDRADHTVVLARRPIRIVGTLISAPETVKPGAKVAVTLAETPAFFDRLRIVPRGMSPARFDKSESVDPDQARQATITAPGGAGDYDILLVDESPGVRDTLVVDRRPLTVR